MSWLAYDRAGAGAPLVLLHPLGADRRVWRPLWSRLTAERDVIAVDLPGFGDSAALAGEPSPRALAAAVVSLLRDLGLGPAHYAGNSLGGWVALEAALAGDAARVTAIAPAGLWASPLGPRPETARRAARTLRPLLRPLLRLDAVKRAVLGGTTAHPERVPAADAAALVSAYADAPGFSEVNRAMRAGTFSRLAEVTVPVTLIWPEHDGMIARLKRVPPGVREVVLADAGHLPMWDQPDALAHLLLEAA